GAEGEIAAKGPSVHLGYYKNPTANAELFTADGWFRTGDLGVMEPSGNVRIVGRLKEMINRGGKKFFPREVEEILYTHPSVLHAAIVGVPDPRLGERNCLCVIPRPGTTVSLPELVAYVREAEMAEHFRKTGVRVMLDLGVRMSQSVDEARALHDYAFATQREHPDVILGHWLHIDPRHGRDAGAELDRCLRAAPGVVGLGVPGSGFNAPPTIRATSRSTACARTPACRSSSWS